MSSWRITRRAAFNMTFVLENRPRLQVDKLFPVRCNLWKRMWHGSAWMASSFQALLTTSSNPGMWVQKFSNLKVRRRWGPESSARSKEQWPNKDNDIAWRTCVWKHRFHSMLQKKASSLKRVGLTLSLLHVNLQFWRWFSWSSQVCSVARKRL
jgi:hypothetical protein